MAANTNDTRRLPRAQSAHASRRRSLAAPGALLSFVVSSVVGTALVVLAYHEAKTSAGELHFAVFWAGLFITLAGCVSVGMLSSSPRVLSGVLLWFGFFTFLPKFLMTANGPAYFDEFGHFRHVQDMVATGHIGVSDPLLPVVQYYPGLGLATEGIHYVTRLNLWHSGQVVILGAHCGALLLMAAICGLMDFGVRGRFFAAMMFAANPAFLYFDSQYAYESLAITMMLGTAYCCLRVKRAADAGEGTKYTVIGCLLATCTVFTHHIAAIVTLAFCLLIAAVSPSYGHEADLASSASSGQLRRNIHSWIIAGWTAFGVGVWVFGVAGTTRQYLYPSLENGVRQTWDKVFGSSATPPNSVGGVTVPTQNTSHTPFAGTSVPSYEKYTALVVPFVVLAVVLFSLWSMWKTQDRWRELRLGAPFIVFAVGYFVSLPISLTTGGNQAAHRSWPFFYVGVAVLSVWTLSRKPASDVPFLRRDRVAEALSRKPTRPMLALVALFVVLLGNNVAGANVVQRFPGPYVFGSDARFSTPELAGLTKWSARNLPAGIGVVTDRYTAQAILVGTRLVTPNSKQAAVYGLYRSPSPPPAYLRAYLRLHNFRYFILDERITTQLPSRPFFQSYRGYTESIDPVALATITDSAFIRLIHSTAHYRVYQLSP